MEDRRRGVVGYTGGREAGNVGAKWRNKRGEVMEVLGSLKADLSCIKINLILSRKAGDLRRTRLLDKLWLRGRERKQKSNQED